MCLCLDKNWNARYRMKESYVWGSDAKSNHDNVPWVSLEDRKYYHKLGSAKVKPSKVKAIPTGKFHKSGNKNRTK